MKEICKLAQEKGFKAKTVSTQVAYKFHLGIGKNIMLNDTCDYLLLCEIQKWIREIHDIDVIINTYRSQGNKWYKFFISEQNKDVLKSDDYKSYEEALKAGIKESLKTE